MDSSSAEGLVAITHAQSRFLFWVARLQEMKKRHSLAACFESEDGFV